MKNNPLNSSINNNTPYYYLFPRSLADLNVPFKDPTSLLTPSVLKLSVSDGKVQFETSSVEKVNIYAVTGQLVKSLNSQIGTNSIALPNGIYIVKISNEITKIIIH
jgi:hypothetical protein